MTRARIILLAADREPNTAIGDAVGIHYNNVAVWRKRYEAEGLEGLKAVLVRAGPSPSATTTA